MDKKYKIHKIKIGFSLKKFMYKNNSLYMEFVKKAHTIFKSSGHEVEISDRMVWIRYDYFQFIPINEINELIKEYAVLMNLKKKPLTLDFAIKNKYSPIDLIKYFNPNWSDDDCNEYLWNETCYPFSNEILIQDLNKTFLKK